MQEMKSESTTKYRWPRRALLIAVGCSIGAGCGLVGQAQEFFGSDTSTQPETCVVIAPDLLPTDELASTIKEIVDDVANNHGTIKGYVAVGASASSFLFLNFSIEANAGVLGSNAGSEGARDGDAKTWAAKLLAELQLQLQLQLQISVELPGEEDAGLDLFGGIDQCARQLANAIHSPTIVVVSHGIHRTSDFDLVVNADEAPFIIPEHVVPLVPEPIHLVLYELGRIDPSANGGPARRAIVESVVAGWVEACRQLEDRCSIGKEPS
jgi:hypothetical protein